MNRTLLWRDLRALSKDLCEILNTDHGNKTASLSYCLNVVDSINKRFDQPSVAPVPFSLLAQNPTPAFMLGVDAPAQSLLLGTTKPKGFFASGMFSKSGFNKKPPVYLTPKAALDQVMVIGCTGSGRTETLLTLAANAAADKKGVFYMDGKGDISLYAKTMGHLSEIGRVGDIRVINLMSSGPGQADSSKISHTLDLFQGMDWQALATWMQQVAPVARNQDEQNLSRQLLSELCPLVSRLLFYWSIHTGKRITPGMVCMGLTHQGILDLVELLAEEDKPAHRELLKATLDPQGLECAALEDLAKHLLPLSLTWGHVFQSDTPEVGLLDSFKEKHFVLVQAPAMHKFPLAHHVITSAINASLCHAMNTLPVSGLFDHLVVLDEFLETVNDQILYDLSAVRNRGCGVVWGSEHAPTQKQRLRWQADQRGAWRAPGTHILMKQCSDHIDPAYFQWQGLQHEALALGVSVFGNTDTMREGEAFIYSGSEIHEVIMDYRAARSMGKLFIPHANPLAAEDLTLPGPMKRPSRGSSHRDKDKQAIVLFDRLSEFDERNLGRGYPPKLSWCQETLARMMGFAHWHEAQIRCAPADE